MILADDDLAAKIACFNALSPASVPA